MIYKLNPAFKDYIWGGVKLKNEWGKRCGYDRIAESWELSFHQDGLSEVENGESAGRTLKEVVTKVECGPYRRDFPVLIKLIDSAKDLSVQVHPSDEFALENEGQYGKTEMWYVADCEKGAGLYVGFKRNVERLEFEKAITDGTVLDLLNFFEVKKGDCFFIPSGTVHAIGAGVTVCEIQENSNVTYRVYDYGRLGADGRPRQLHIDKALKVADLSVYKPNEGGKTHNSGNTMLCSCKYFTVFECVDSTKIGRAEGYSSVTVISGKYKLGGLLLAKGETAFLTVGESAEMKGEGIFLYTYTW